MKKLFRESLRDEEMEESSTTRKKEINFNFSIAGLCKFHGGVKKLNKLLLNQDLVKKKLKKLLIL